MLSIKVPSPFYSFHTHTRAAIRESKSIPPPFKICKYDALKIRHQAHRTKVSLIVPYPTLLFSFVLNLFQSGDLLIDMTGDPVTRSNQPLSTVGIENETEVAFFNSADYAAQASNPEFLW
ncbi:hypothetical protein FBUS_09186 [Fasciolopsis buskii]|uniref:Uncharacterized protein n=1 Tax=Fasciolopsis buskii TaxID=27845 RepID=A0A8E0VJV2_9TREM|nr:hypothetical protein FBUS_09186 [Fasciolopsis buski]